MLDVCLLGTAGTMPLPHRNLSAALVRLGGKLVLIDCGEGTQVAMRARGWGLRHLSNILITHVHGDHVLGLPGLLTTLAFTGRGEDEPITILGPEPLLEVVKGLMVVAPKLPYPVRVGTLSGHETFELDQTNGLVMNCAPALHRAPCLAYSLEVPRAPRFEPERARALDVPVQLWRRLQRGEEVRLDGRTISPGEVQGPERRGIRMAFVTDTSLTPELVEFVYAGGKGVDLLISDAMYGEGSQRPDDYDPQHLTFSEAATLARDGNARQLWLTHFSARLSDPEAYLDHATSIFPCATAGNDGLTTTLNFED